MALRRLAALVLALLVAAPAPVLPAASSGTRLPGLEALDNASLKSIAAWLRQSGREGYLGADVADAAGIPRAQSEDTLEVSQRGFRSGEVLRVAQLSADEKRSFLLFMVQREGDVTFYVSSVKDGLVKAFVSVPGTRAVLKLEPAEAQSSFQSELRFWEARVAGS